MVALLRLHFLNVGKGNCTIVQFPSGRVGVIDIDDSKTIPDEELEALAILLGRHSDFLRLREAGLHKASRLLVESVYETALTDPVEYYASHVGVSHVGDRVPAFRFILTHPDMDHMSGLVRLNERFGIINFWDTRNNKTIPDDSWESSEFRKEDWDLYQRLRFSESSPKCIRPQRDEVGKFWDEDQIEILAPTDGLSELADATEDYNHVSYVLRISHAGRRVLIGGDATVEVWDDVLQNYGRHMLRADVLLAPHHGSKHNFHREAMEAVAPKLVIVSVHAGKDYAYDEYKGLSSEPEILSTKWWGDIVVTIEDDGTIAYNTQYKR